MKDLNLKISELKLLDPNEYTERNNPVLSALFHTFLNDELGNNSDEVQTLMNENIAQDKFLKSLTPQQMDLYDEMYWENSSITSKIETERFIFGFKLALMLFNEGYKGYNLRGVPNEWKG